MIMFKSLRIVNFRSYAELKLDNLNSMGLTLISGDNGVGKSTIRQAIEYLLLDQTSDNIPVDELCRDGDKPCTLQCELEMPNGDKVRIVKYRNDPTEKNKTYLYVNGNDSLTTTDRRVTQKNIEQLLGITPDLLFSSTMFSQNSPSFVECAEKDRKEILYNFIDREKYDKLLRKTQACVQEAESLILDINAGFANVQSQIGSAEEYYAQLDDAEKEYIEEAKAVIIELLKNRRDLAPIPTEILEEEIKDLKLDIVDVDKDKIERLNNKLSLIDRRTNEVYTDIKVNEKQLDSIKSNKCPSLDIDCPFLYEERSKLERELEPVIKDLSEVLETLKQKDSEVVKSLDACLVSKENNLKISTRLDSKVRELDTTNKYNKQLSKSIEQLDNQIKAKSETLKDNKFSKLREETKEKIKNLQIDLEKLNKDRDWLEIDKQYYDYWVTGFSRAGIPNMKMEGILGSLEEETNNYLSRISDNIYVEIDAQTELKSSDVKEKISYKVNHPDKAIKNYNSYSGGERQRVKLSDIFAFNSLLGKFDIMILDEVLEGSIDDKGKSVIISLLKEKSSELGSLFVISHDDYIKDSFDNVMWVKKTNGISKIRG